jgi:hypothetical protein|tara:strand:- start:1286 stop:1546 length:261 start_codon:yes stop_codon:yes gene_type:complete
MSETLNRQWREFVLEESLADKDIFSYIQALEEYVKYSKPKTLTEKRRLSVAKQNIKEVKRFARRMEGKIGILQEKLNILEESVGDE